MACKIQYLHLAIPTCEDTARKKRSLHFQGLALIDIKYVDSIHYQNSLVVNIFKPDNSIQNSIFNIRKNYVIDLGPFDNVLAGKKSKAKSWRF